MCCHTTKCDSGSRRESPNPAVSVGLHPAEHRELAGPCSCTVSAEKAAATRAWVCAGKEKIGSAFHIAYFSQPLF